MKLLKFALAASIVMSPSPITAQSPITLSPQDMASAEWGYEYYYRSAVDKTLYEKPALAPDGVHEYVPNTTYQRSGDIARLQQEYCEARLPAVARATVQRTVLAENKKAVFTITRFTVEKTLRSGTPVKPGGEITAVELGGTVTDEHGVKLRVGYLNGAPFVIGHSYLLFLYQAPFRHTKVYLSNIEKTEVVDSHLSKVGPLQTSFDDTAFKQGESFDEFWKSLQLYLDHHPCYESALPSPETVAFYDSLP
jgi:hypothetical protein